MTHDKGLRRARADRSTSRHRTHASSGIAAEITGVAQALQRILPRIAKRVRTAHLARPYAPGEAPGAAARHEVDAQGQGQCLELLRNIGGAVLWKADRAGIQLSFVSETADALLGIPAHEWQAEPGFLREHVHPDDWSRLLDAMYQAGTDGGVHICEHRMLKADGTTLQVQTSVRGSATPDRAPALYGVTVMLSRAERDATAPADDGAPRKQTHQTVHSNERQLELLIESVQDYAVFMVSTGGTVEGWNRGAQRVKGYRAHEILGANIARFFPPEAEAEGMTVRLLEQASLRGSATYEGWLVRKGGSRFWGIVTLAAVEDEEGRLVGFSNVARDLTERRRTEEVLRDREERLRLLLESVQDHGMFMISTEGHVEGWNPGAERLKGYQAQEIIGAPFTRFFLPEDVARGTPDRLRERAATEGRADYEGWLVRKGGARFWASIVLSAVRDEEGNLRGFSNVSSDLTNRMRVERAQAFLSEAGAALAGSLEHQTTLDKVVRLATPRLSEWCVVHMLEGGVLRPIVVTHADPRLEQAARSALRSVPLEPAQAHAAAFVVRTGQSELCADASEAPWVAEALGVDPPEALNDLRVRSFLCVPLTARGKTFGAITLLSAAPRQPYDLGDLMLAEELARRAALALDNARLYREAQDVARAQDEFISIASHDLRGPLQTMRLQVHALVRNIGGEPGQLPEKVVTRLGGLQKQVERMVQMFDALLDISRITSGRLTLAREQVDASALVRDCAGRVAEDAEQADCELRVRADDAIVGSWDRLRIEQVVTNLLSNAIKYGKGAPIDVSVSRAGAMVSLGVRDHGVGIPPEDQARIFDRFERVGDERSVGGFGMGLWIVRRIVEAHAGNIRVDSEAGAGTTFTVDLPLAP